MDDNHSYQMEIKNMQRTKYDGSLFEESGR